MSSALRLLKRIPIPPERSGDFDHGDVDPTTGRVFVAHTSEGTVDVIDGNTLEVIKVIEGCPEGSGVLCAPSRRAVIAAARGAGQVLHINADTLDVVGTTAVGPKPNGLALDPTRSRVLVADVDGSDQRARLVDLNMKQVIAEAELPGRPRWCVFDQASDAFLVNVREPATVVSVAGSSGVVESSWAISSAGPHGSDLDREGKRVFVACDGGELIAVDLRSGRELGTVRISGVPDATWFNPTNKRIYVAVANPGVIDVIDAGALKVVESFPTERGAKTTAIDIRRQRLYVFLPQSCSAAVLEAS